jgi:hypothetical protein
MKRKVKVEDIDSWTPRRILYWIGDKRNSIEIKMFFADYFRRKYPDNEFWIQILRERGLI